MKWSIEQKIRVGFGLGLACLLVIGAVSYRSATRFTETFRGVEQTDLVLDELNQTLVAILNAETGERGYALTGNPLYLEAIEPGSAIARKKLKALRKLTLDNPVQQQRLDILEPLIATKLEFISRLIERRKNGIVEPVARTIAMGDAKKMMDEIRTRIDEMEQTERELLEGRSRKTKAEARQTMNVVLLGSLVAVLFVVLASLIVPNDFRKRRRAEDERDRFFTLSLDMLCIAGFDGYFKRVNPAWERVLGFTPEELMREPYSGFIHPDDLEATTAVASKIAAGAEVISFENRYRCKDGSYRWLLWSAAPLVEAQVIYAAARDITERKQVDARIEKLNNELKEHAGQLEAANNELEAFSYSVSHDLRAPLRHMGGFLELLQKKAGPVLDEPSQRYVKLISESAREMGALIDDLLAFSRMSRAEMRAASVDLRRLVEETIKDLEPEAAGREIDWKIAPLPEVQADPSLLRQVLVNLLSNSIKYSRTRDHAEIEIGCQPEENGQRVFFVRDNGVGFDMQYAGKLFGVFQRLHDSSEFEGTGIGLATVQRIVGRHGGRTWAEGVVDGGATFYFSLPKAA